MPVTIYFHDKPFVVPFFTPRDFESIGSLAYEQRRADIEAECARIGADKKQTQETVMRLAVPLRGSGALLIEYVMTIAGARRVIEHAIARNKEIENFSVDDIRIPVVVKRESSDFVGTETIFVNPSVTDLENIASELTRIVRTEVKEPKKGEAKENPTTGAN